ncbi:enamine deaminase RidA [Paenibacillus azoreducens]|jgi:enamine deaminase RidA (YjgF/YER057c/UK114 family)|uniref:Enamine deaminase RidA n=2 Tax=Paenibacillus azoreducens TaxID=116718 RepID=A0A920CRL4_9BACL|nr:enamine deaminase RidA [Paenibacillus azoreducens]
MMNMNKKIVQRHNPEIIAKPVGKYSHVTKISRNAEMYVFSGQIGTDQNGQIPADFNQQVTNTMKNIVDILASQHLTPDHVVKINIWAVEKIDWDHFYEVWDQVFGQTPPSMTIAYVKELGLPEIQIELDVWAAG